MMKTASGEGTISFKKYTCIFTCSNRLLHFAFLKEGMCQTF